jgi:HTH-type transcriptional regulator / antitoxin HigA
MSMAEVKTRHEEPLAELVPSAICNEAEYDRAIEQIEKLLKKGDRISPEEENLLDLLSTLVEKYEFNHYPIGVAAPHEILQHLMDLRETTPLEKERVMDLIRLKSVFPQ